MINQYLTNHNKMTKLLLYSYLIFSYTFCFAQDIIDVTDQKIKVGGLSEEILYFGFAEGDKIIFNFQEIDKKELKELEIAEYPSNSKFSDFKTSKIENKTLNVSKTGVYVFRFKNTAFGGRICNIKIQRIPASDKTKGFNSAVTWETKQETTYNNYTKDVLVGYDTTYIPRKKIELVKTEIREEAIFDKLQRVHSISNGSSNRTSLYFTLPINQLTTYKTTKVVSWAYWVGIGDEANNAWKQNIKILSNVATKFSSSYISPLGAFAVGQMVELILPKVGEDVFYAIADETNKDLFISKNNQFKIFDQGKGIAGYRKFTDPGLCQGSFFVLLLNDNTVMGIDAQVKVIAMVETNYYADKIYNEMTVRPRYEKKQFSDPVVNTSKIPVTGK